MIIKIWTVTTDVENTGTETRAFATEWQALGAVDAFCLERWREEFGDIPDAPLDALEGLRLFDCPDLLWLEEHELELDLVQAYAPGYLRPPVGDDQPTPWIKGVGA